MDCVVNVHSRGNEEAVCSAEWRSVRRHRAVESHRGGYVAT